jgi:cation:H+ antiporter
VTPILDTHQRGEDDGSMLSILWLVVGGVLLYVGAESLIRGAVALAARAGMSPLVIGLTVVAAGTSMPELVVSLTGALQGQTELAIGNVMGSNICNILLITGLTALIRPITVERSVVRREVPLMIGITLLVGGLMLWGQAVVRWEAVLMLALLAGGIYWSIRTARTDAPLAYVVATVPASPIEIPLGRSVLWIVLGMGGLVLGGNRFVEGAVDLARGFGLSEATIGLTVVAIGTSLPELATSVVAALKREGDMALGNVVGSNIFNLLGILGVAGLVLPLPLPLHGWSDLGVMVLTAVVLLPMARSGFCLQRWEGGLLFSGYIVYMAWLLMR